MGWALAYVCGFLLNKEYGFVVRCKWCSIMCEAWAYTFSHVIIHWCYKKTLFIEEYIGASQESVLHILHPTRTHIFVFMSFGPFCLLPIRSRKSMWRTFWKRRVFYNPHKPRDVGLWDPKTHKCFHVPFCYKKVVIMRRHWFQYIDGSCHNSSPFAEIYY